MKTDRKKYYNIYIKRKERSDLIMDKNAMPANLSYTLLVHAGSYKDFVKKMATNFKDLDIVSVKQRAVHYYIVCVTENGNTEYKKADIYKLPIMALKEEFSNYLFFKSVKAYNNVLKFMCGGTDNKNAPYELYTEMLTSIEKFKYGNVSTDTNSLTYISQLANSEMLTTVYGKNQIFTKDTLAKVFASTKMKVNEKEIDFVELLKKQKLQIGII